MRASEKCVCEIFVVDNNSADGSCSMVISHFPEVKIIHYKGESTKKGSMNYFVHFNKAMIIFVKKHFIGSRNRIFLFIIWTAVYFYGFIELLRDFSRKFFLPVADAALLYGLFALVNPIWENFKFRGDYSYPDLSYDIIVPFYALVTVYLFILQGITLCLQN
jgi:hypothetical protein